MTRTNSPSIRNFAAGWWVVISWHRILFSMLVIVMGT